MDLVVGSFETPHVDVAPYDVSGTSATLTLYAPDGTTSAVPLGAGVVTSVDGQQVLRFTATTPVQYTVAGWWVLAATVTGVGAGPGDRRFFVAPTPTVADGPLWTPTLERVGTYIPERTVAVDRLSDGQPVLTFTDDTRPTAAQVTSQIEGACAWVLLAVGDLDPSLSDAAREVAAIRAAGMAEISWPVRDGDLNAGQALLTQADAGLKQLHDRNETLTGVDPEDPESSVLPVWSFPPAPCYGDSPLF